MTDELLGVTGVSKQFLGLRAVDDVTLSVKKGEILSIIGPNGAGKTTFFNLLTGQLVPTSGEVRLRGAPINRLPPHARARLGMGRTFQIAKPLIGLNALENVMIGAFLHHAKLATARDKAMAVLETVGLAHHAGRRAGDLTLSERRRLEVARALALEPEIVLLDEVMAGLNQSEVGQTIDLLKGLHATGLTFLIIEHNLKVVRAFSERVVVLDRGRLIAEGSADEILSAPQVIKAYLGEKKGGEKAVEPLDGEPLREKQIGEKQIGEKQIGEMQIGEMQIGEMQIRELQPEAKQLEAKQIPDTLRGEPGFGKDHP